MTAFTCFAIFCCFLLLLCVIVVVVVVVKVNQRLSLHQTSPGGAEAGSSEGVNEMASASYL